MFFVSHGFLISPEGGDIVGLLAFLNIISKSRDELYPNNNAKNVGM